MKTSSPQKLGFSPERLDRLDSSMSRYVDDGRIAGIQVSLSRHGEMAHAVCFGKADIETDTAIGMDTIFRIYSMTKPIAGVAAMMLHEEGRFNLNDPVSRYIPWFENMNVLDHVDTNGHAEVVPAESEMKIWHMLTHTSGLSYGFDDSDPLDQIYITEISRARQENPLLSLEAMVERIAALPLAHHPGTAWRYSFATDVVGYLVQVIAGVPFDVFLQERVFEPLGMGDTGFYVPESKRDRFAVCYGPGDDGRLAVVPDSPLEHRFLKPGGLISGGGGLVSTGPDYMRFAGMLLNGGALDGVRLLGPKTVELMTMDHLGGTLHPFDDPANGFGLGFAVLTDVAATRIAGSVGSYGWAGAANTCFWVDPVEDLIAILMLQYMPNNTYPVVPDFRTAVYQALIE